MTPVSSPARRLALSVGLLAAVLISCGREVTGPVSVPVNAFRRVASLAFDPHYETALKSSALRAALTQVAFERVRITLRREDGSIALDTVVNFPAGADALTLSLTVLLPANAPETGVPFSLNLGYVNAAGDTVFKGGPTAVTVTPSRAGSSPPPPVQVPVQYTGTGANATAVVIAPRTASGTAGQTVNFTAQALRADGQPIAGTPIVFASSDPGVARISDPASGLATLVGRGTAKIYAQLLTGPTDSATVTVILPASRIELTSGSAQTGPVGRVLPQPVVARVLAADGIGVGGVTVSFAVTAGGGSVSPASAVSAADGSVSTAWTLGGIAGAHAMTVSAGTLLGSPIAVSATGLPVVASRLAITTGPVSSTAGAPLGAVVVAQDESGNTVTSFTGDVSAAIGANPGGATLGGTVTVRAVGGIATFSGLSLNKPGTAYTLVFSSTTLVSTTSAAFNIVAGDAARLVFGPMPATVDAGIAIAPPLQVMAQDASGNAVTGFTGAVTLALGANPGTSTLSGTVTRNAVAGVATFNDLAINKKGASYTFVASSTTLASGTSAPFNVAPGAPIGVFVVSGNGQTALAGAVLAPVLLQVRDALGNGIAGVTVALAVATGGGSVAPASQLTDENGFAIASWTLGNTGGPQSITATATGLPVFTITATATVPPTTATQLVIAAPPQSTQTAGTSGTAIVVQAKDAGNVVVPAFVGNVSMTIASGPLGATVIGPVSATAVAGVATFGGVSFDKAGAYTVTFASAGLTSATSTSFTVGAGAAKNIAADSGQAQSGPASTLLGTKLVIKVTDLYGNPVTGTSIAWAAATGGGSVDSATTVTNAAGRTRVQWTLGGTVGAQTATATSAGLTGSPLTFTATAGSVAYSKLWTGADSLWTTAGNWSPLGVPAATDSVQVNAAANGLKFPSAATMAKLIVAAGGYVTLNGNYVRVDGSVIQNATGTFASSGVLELKGASGTIVGPGLPFTTIWGNYTLAGATGFLYDVEVKTGGTFNTNGFNVNVVGGLQTSTTGTLVMSGGTMTLGDNAYFDGASENGLLTGGTLRIRGNFTQSNSGGHGEAFRSSGTHQVQFDSISIAGMAHRVSFASPDTALSATCTAGRSCFNIVSFGHVVGFGAGIRFLTSAKVLGAVDFAAAGIDSVAMPAASLLTIAGNFSTGCCTPRHFNRLALGGGTNNGGVSGVTVDTMIFFGTAQTAAPNGILIGTNSVRIAGTATLTQGNIPGNLTVDGAGAVADIGTTSGNLAVGGNFVTTNGGKLKMTDAPDSLNVGGTITFAGGSTVGLLTDGIIIAQGDFTTGGAGASAQSFAASGNHVVTFASASPKRLRMLNGGFGSSQFHELYHGFLATLYLKTDVFAESFETGIVANHVIASDTSFSPVLVAKGAALRDVSFNGATFELRDGFPVTDLDSVSFNSQDPTVSQFTIKRTGTGTTGSITPLTRGWAFTTVPTTGKYLDAQDTDGGSPDSLFVNFAGTVSPSSNGGRIALTNGAKTNWVAGASYVSNGIGNWDNPLSWTPNGTPGAGDDVTIGLSTSISLAAPALVHTLTITGGGTLNLGNFALTVNGDVSAAGVNINGNSTSTLAITGAGAHTVALNAVRNMQVDVGAVVSLATNLNIGGQLTIAGRLLPNAHNLYVTENSTYSATIDIQATGGLKLTQATDSVFVDNITFNGVASDTLLTAGYLRVLSTLSQGGASAKSFAPTGTHVTALTGDGQNNALRESRTMRVTEVAVPRGGRRSLAYNQLLFANPGYAASRFNILVFNHASRTIAFGSDAYAMRADMVGAPSGSISSFGGTFRLHVQGVGLSHLTFDKLALQVDEGGTIDSLRFIRFINQDPTKDQLTISRNSGALAFDSLSFGTLLGPSATGHYMKLVDAQGGSDLTVTMNNVSPGSHGGHALFINGAFFTDWSSVRNMVASSNGNWDNVNTWSPAGVPSPYDNVTINTGATVALGLGSSMVAANNVTVQTGANLTQFGGPVLDVYGNWTADTLGTFTGNTPSSVTNFRGLNATIRGRFWNARFWAPTALSGPTIFDGNVVVGTNTSLPVTLVTLDINGQVARVRGGFQTVNQGGRLKMTNPADVLTLLNVDWASNNGNTTLFYGGSTDGLLTDGIINLSGTFQQGLGDPAAFSASGNHRVIIKQQGTSTGNSLYFTNPGTSSVDSHFGILQLSDDSFNTELKTSVFAVTKVVTLGTTGAVSIVRDPIGIPPAIAPILGTANISSTLPLVLNRVKLKVYNADASTSLANVTFQNFTNNTFEHQLTVEGTGTVMMSGLTFTTASVNTYNYLYANNIGGGMTVNLTGMSPNLAGAAGKIAVTGAPTAVVNWSP